MNQYKVQIVGLAYFLHERDGRHVLMPDGRNIPDVIEHIATIAVAADELADENSFTGWSEGDITRTPVDAAISGTGVDRVLLQFELKGDTVEIEGVSSTVRGEAPNTVAHDKKLQPLTDNGKRVKIDPAQAKTVADFQIRRGTLRATRYPGTDDDGKAAVITELTVPYEGETVTVTVRPKGSADGKNVRTITVRNGIEFVIVNASRPNEAGKEDETNHFRIYEQLAPGVLKLEQPRSTPIGFPGSDTDHLLFHATGVIGSSVKCGNTCC